MNSQARNPEETGMDLHAEHEAAATVATPGLGGTMRLDNFNAIAFELAMRKLISESSGAMILDMQAVSYISSAGLRVALVAAKELEKQDRQFRLCSLSKPVHNVFSVGGLVANMHICSDRSEALASLAS